MSVGTRGLPGKSGEIQGQQVSRHELPDWAQDVITEELSLTQGVGDLQALVRQSRAAGKTAVKMVPPGTADMLMLWSHERQNSGGGTIMALYCDVNVARIEGVLDQIRTTLVRLVSEMRATMPDDSSVPSPEQAASAVNVVLNGGKRSQFTVTTAMADGGASASVTLPTAHKDSGWTKTQTIWTVLGVIVAVLTLYLTLK